MRRDSRLPVALHVLLHMSESEVPLSSEALGPQLTLNPVVLRRTLAGLRDAGIVHSEKGHGGGWRLARGLEDVTLADVYRALGITSLFSIGHRDERPKCRLEQAVKRALDDTLSEAEALVLERLRETTIADVLADATKSKAKIRKKESHQHA